MADVGIVATGARGGANFRKAWFPEPRVPSLMADHPGRILDQCGINSNELPIRNLLNFYDGRNVGHKTQAHGDEDLLTVAYLKNEFPCPVESCIPNEIAELRTKGL